MIVAWRCIGLSVVTFLVVGCAISPISPYEEQDLSTRASEKMAPANPSRGTKTIHVAVRTPPELDVRLVTFYSQFRPSIHLEKPVPRGGKVAEGCWWSKSSLLQEERFYYSRVFYYPVGNGASVQDLVLDEVVPGTCNIGITGIGYEVALKAPKGDSVIRSLVRFDIAVEEGWATSADATIRCFVIQANSGKTSALRCRRERQASDPMHLGPLATSGAALTLDFRLDDMASQ